MSQRTLLINRTCAKATTDATETTDANWKESDHPRNGGKFAKKGTGTTGKTAGKESDVAGEVVKNFAIAARKLDKYDRRDFEKVANKLVASKGEISYRDAVEELRKMTEARQIKKRGAREKKVGSKEWKRDNKLKIATNKLQYLIDTHKIPVDKEDMPSMAKAVASGKSAMGVLKAKYPNLKKEIVGAR